MLDSTSKNWILKNLPLFSSEVKDAAIKRLQICQKCPKLKPKLNRCEECGCLMPAKVFLKRASCPLKKWGVMELKDGD